MNWWKTTKETYEDAVEAIEDVSTPTYNRLLAVGVVTNVYLAGSLSYFAYKGGKALIKALKNK